MPGFPVDGHKCMRCEILLRVGVCLKAIAVINVWLLVFLPLIRPDVCFMYLTFFE